ncbi:hydrogenase expression/formation protein HypE [Thiomicrorhabdus sp. ZW0627]|uniref:hydrogenase expression/formation protein HypE n=1 Tax=Thiomicrorhabdus sp. ZW0627 TaxID=3039774 RepID=UPI002436F4A3|nr:hydrogenase expression/formation protein HypE [Thiomicrorhabdus sp. ZW0627]MDG6774150.1 hydrogenase expression/formation protein HypE [Thiomicrorhabdus sp. ZW0627]
MKVVELSHGGGGAETQQLIQQLFYRHFANDVLLKSEDAAVLSLQGQTAFTTDSFTVSPLFFSGGNIGNLAIAGTLNDLSMMGAKPLYLSCAFIIEEGLPFDTLEKVVQSMADELQNSDAKIVCGDTKVVPRGAVDKLFINTSGIGEISTGQIVKPSAHNLQMGDAVIVSGDIGRHGAVVMAERESINLHGDFKSDCQVLWPAVKALLDAGLELHALRDATRGGLAALLNEWANSSEVCIEIEEEKIPVSESVRGLCELLGFEAYDFANEGTFAIALPCSQVEQALQVLSQFDFTQKAAVIGKVTDFQAGLVVLQTPWGSQRVLELPKGELLPRIC